MTNDPVQTEQVQQSCWYCGHNEGDSHKVICPAYGATVVAGDCFNPYERIDALTRENETLKQEIDACETTLVEYASRAERYEQALESIASKHGFEDRRFRAEALAISRAALTERSTEEGQ